VYIPKPFQNESASSYSNRLGRLSVPTGGKQKKRVGSKAWRKTSSRTKDEGTVYEGMELVRYLMSKGAFKQAKRVFDRLEKEGK